jgi:transposase-like protein
MNEVEKDRITELKHELRRQHKDMASLAKTALDRMINIGALLTEAKALVYRQYGQGKWLAWVSQNVAFTHRWCNEAMLLYENQSKLELKCELAEELTCTGALRLIREMKKEDATLPTSSASEGDMGPPTPDLPEEPDGDRPDHQDDHENEHEHPSTATYADDGIVPTADFDYDQLDNEPASGHSDHTNTEISIAILKACWRSNNKTLPDRISTAFRAFTALSWVAGGTDTWGEKKPSLRALGRGLNISHNTLEKWVQHFRSQYGIRCPEQKTETAAKKYSQVQKRNHWRNR